MLLYQCHIKESAGKEVREDCEFGWNDKSWRLWCSNNLNRWSFRHNNKSSVIIDNSLSSNRAGVYVKNRRVCGRVGVYVDMADGILSFYSVADTHTHTLTHIQHHIH